MKINKPFKSYKGDGKFAYACYCIDDHEFVFPFLQKLHEDRYRIRYDEGVQDEIGVDALRKHNIRNCEVFLVFMSQKALQSPYFLNQIEVAQQFGVNTYVIYLDGNNTVEQASRFFDARVNSIRMDECEEDIVQDVIGQLLVECREPEVEEERVYTYDELLDEVYPDQANESKETFEATVHQDEEKIQKSAAFAVGAAKAAKIQKRQRKGIAFLNALLVVGVMIAIAVGIYFLFGEQLKAALSPDEVVNFIPSFGRLSNAVKLIF